MMLSFNTGTPYPSCSIAIAVTPAITVPSGRRS
jgi:hypothetical protein